MMLRRRKISQSRKVSGIVGAILLGLGCVWLVWLLLHQYGVGAGFTFPIPGFAPVVAQVPPLVAAGITLEHTDQAPALNQQQAVLIASQIEPNAAAKAKKIGAQYVLLNYTPTGTPTTHPAISNVPAWLILYQSVPQDPNNTSADPASTSSSSHDLYVFLDANSGKELLAVWV